MPTKADVVEVARSWSGTPFQHQGRLKGRACDCVGLPLCVCQELKLVDRLGVPFKSTDNANYSSQPLDAFVQDECRRRMIEKPISEMQDGDLLTMRVPTVPCHVAFVSSVGGTKYIIHAYSGLGKVTEHILDAQWRRRIESCFALPGVDGK